VIVLPRAGDEAPAPWSLLPATDSAGGRVLLAYRQSWRDDQRPDDESSTPRLDLEARATEVRHHGYAVHDQGATTSLAVPVPMVPTPLAALVLTGRTNALSGDGRWALLTALRRAAARLGDSYHPAGVDVLRRDAQRRGGSRIDDERRRQSASPTPPSGLSRPTEPTRSSACAAPPSALDGTEGADRRNARPRSTSDAACSTGS
jgi:hypothetical protein